MAKILVISQFKAKAGKEKELVGFLQKMGQFSHCLTGLETSQISRSQDNPQLFLTYAIYTSAESYNEMKKAFQNDLEMGKNYMAMTELLVEKPVSEKFEIVE